MLTLYVANPTHEYTLTASERYISRKKPVGSLRLNGEVSVPHRHRRDVRAVPPALTTD